MTQQRADVAVFKGNPVTLLGPDVAVGDQAPEF
ncbi:MAG: thiol peroxidase, partial [Desulfuromonas sp.]